MKLELSENLRRLRRERELSQEQLAEKLSISVSSLSRWETGATYPDVEFLPVIAGFFGVTTDELLGVPSSLAHSRKAKYWDEIDRSPEESTDLVRCAWAEFPNDWWFAVELCSRLKKDPEKIPEALRIAYDALEKCTDMAVRSFFVGFIAEQEDEDKIFDFLENNVSDSDNSRTALLMGRYSERDEFKKYEPLAQLDRMRKLEWVLRGIADNHNEDHPESMIKLLCATFDYLNVISGIDEEIGKTHPILGDGVPDMWIDVRILNGIDLACRLVRVGKINETLDTLEETVELCARFVTLPDGAVVTYRMISGTPLSARLTLGSDGWRHAVAEDRIGFRREGEEEIVVSWPPQKQYAQNTLELLESSEWFDSVRNHQRFVACENRLKELAK